MTIQMGTITLLVICFFYVTQVQSKLERTFGIKIV